MSRRGHRFGHGKGGEIDQQGFGFRGDEPAEGQEQEDPHSMGQKRDAESVGLISHVSNSVCRLTLEKPRPFTTSMTSTKICRAMLLSALIRMGSERSRGRSLS